MWRHLVLLWLVLAVVMVTGSAQAAGPRTPPVPGSGQTSGEGAAMFTLDSQRPRVMVINLQGTRLAAVVAGGVRIWSLDDGAELVTYLGPNAGYNNLAFSADGLALAAASPTGLVQVWPVP